MARLYKTTILGDEYTYRGATRAELTSALISFSSDAEVEDYLCYTCSSPPKNKVWEDVFAGVFTTLADRIKDVSGAGKKNKLEEEANDWISTPKGKIESLMMGVLGMDIEKIQSMDPPDWHKTAITSQILAEVIAKLSLIHI
jgi:hypothetical protein